MRRLDLVGKRFGRLAVLAFAGSLLGKSTWACACDCGRTATIAARALVAGHTRSCGCLLKEHARRAGHMHDGSANVTHGATRGGGPRPEYAVWCAMKQRCGNPRNKSYADYGGRGITVCERWATFEKFIADMGPRPSGRHTLERENNDLGYGPDNCVWATRRAQALNKRPKRKPSTAPAA